jgi:hypothetical protein
MYALLAKFFFTETSKMRYAFALVGMAAMAAAAPMKMHKGTFLPFPQFIAIPNIRTDTTAMQADTMNMDMAHDHGKLRISH